MKPILAAASIVAIMVLVAIIPGSAIAKDTKIACVQVGDDAGTTGFIVLPGGNTQIMARCEGYSTRHAIGNGSGTVATSTDSIIDADKPLDTCVDPINDTRISFFKQYDGGNPQCCVYKVRPRTVPCSQP